MVASSCNEIIDLSGSISGTDYQDCSSLKIVILQDNVNIPDNSFLHTKPYFYKGTISEPIASNSSSNTFIIDASINISQYGSIPPKSKFILEYSTTGGKGGFINLIDTGIFENSTPTNPYTSSFKLQEGIYEKDTIIIRIRVDNAYKNIYINENTFNILNTTIIQDLSSDYYSINNSTISSDGKHISIIKNNPNKLQIYNHRDDLEEKNDLLLNEVTCKSNNYAYTAITHGKKIWSWGDPIGGGIGGTIDDFPVMDNTNYEPIPGNLNTSFTSEIIHDNSKNSTAFTQRYSGVASVNNKAYFSPWNSNHIAVASLFEGIDDQLDFPFKLNDINVVDDINDASYGNDVTNRPNLYADAVSLKHKVYFVPHDASKIAVIDTFDTTENTHGKLSYISTNDTSEKKYWGGSILDNKIYFSPYNSNKIGYVDITNDDFNEIDIYQKIVVGEQKYAGSVLVGDYIYFVPYFANNIGILNKNNNNFYTLDLPQNIINDSKKCKYMGAAVLNDKIYFSPLEQDASGAAGILVLDTTKIIFTENTASISSNDTFNTILTDRSDKGIYNYGYSDAITVGNKIYFSPLNASSIGVLDTTNDSFSFSVIDINNTGWNKFSGIVKDNNDNNNNIYFVPYCANIIGKLSNTNGNMSYSEISMNSTTNSTLNKYQGGVYFSGKLYFAPYDSNYIGILDTTTDIFTEISLPSNLQNIKAKFRGVIFNENSLYFIPNQVDNILKYNIGGSANFESNSGFPELEGKIGHYVGAVKADDKIYLVPSNNKSIGVLNTTSNTFDIVAPGEKIVGTSKWKGAVTVDKKIYFIPNEYESIGVLNTELKNESGIFEAGAFSLITSTLLTNTAYWGGAAIDNKIYLSPDNNTPNIGIIDTSNNTFEIYDSLGSNGEGFESMTGAIAVGKKVYMQIKNQYTSPGLVVFDTAEPNSWKKISANQSCETWGIASVQSNPNIDITDPYNEPEGEIKLLGSPYSKGNSSIDRINIFTFFTINKNRTSHKIATELSITNPKQIYSTQSAFAILDNAGKIWAWGNTDEGGYKSSTPQFVDDNGFDDKTVSQIFSTNAAFAALTITGDVWAWGNPNSGGYMYDNQSMQISNLSNVINICSTSQAFAALTENGNVWCWGILIIT